MKNLQKRNKQCDASSSCIFDLLSQELIFAILDKLSSNSSDTKSFSLVSKSFHTFESEHRRNLRPLRPEHLTRIISRYPNLTNLDFTLCPRLADAALFSISNAYGTSLRSIDLSRSRFFSCVGLERLVIKCADNLVELDLSNACELGDSAAKAIAGATNLERLRLERCKMVTDIGIGCIAVGCKKLKLISLKWCVSVGDLGIILIALKCKQIRSLDLSYLPITSKCLGTISELQYLEDLVLQGCFAIDDDSLLGIQKGCKSLKTLDLSSCHNVSHVGLSSLTSAADCLQHLTLAYGAPVTVSLAENLQKLYMLQSLKLDGCPVTTSALKAIANSRISLKELSLSKCPGVTDDGLSSLVMKHPNLTKLDITCCRKITYVSLAHITNSCPNLTSLKMESCSLVPKEAFTLIGRCRILQELDLTDNEIDNEGLRSISRCSELLSLKLGICLDITNKGMAYISIGCPKLIELDMYRCMGITNLGIEAIAHRCTNLEMINIAYCKEITDYSLMALSNCSNLNTLECRGCPLITSLGLAAIAMGCRELANLDIKLCCKVNDAGILPLARYSQNLRQIKLSHTSVTDVGLLSLASIRCLQSMTIMHLKALTPSGLAAALLACGGLTKVKLQPIFKSFLPHQLFEHLEARGCKFEWREKVLQAELDPKCWKIQLEDLYQE
ncbi:unnamed protein product [Rhodiola kirilowii]